MKIERASSFSPTARSAPAPRPGEAGAFADMLRAAVGATGAGRACATTTVAASSALIALQEVEDVGERRRRAVKRANALLDELEDIRNALLTGRLPAATLHRIRALLADRPAQLGDPRLESLIREVELRTEVELAKLERLRSG